jgi:hypothetical protein
MIGVNAMLFVLFVDGLPFREVALQYGCNLCYYWMFLQFPYVECLSIEAGASLLAFVCSNVAWLHYLLNNTDHDLLQILGFFLFMVWAVPLSLFISLSINENVLPGGALAGSETSSSSGPSAHAKGLGGGEKKKNLFVLAFDFVYQLLQQSPLTFGVFSARDSLHSRRN